MTARDKRATVAGLWVFAVLMFFYFAVVWTVALPLISIPVLWIGGRRRV